MIRPITALADGVGSVVPSAVACIRAAGRERLRVAVGAAPAGQETLYDLASLTKPIAVATLLLLHPEISWAEPVAPLLEAPPGPWADVTVRHLLGHASGLPPLARLTDARDVVHVPFESPPGTRAVYSDVGYVALGRFLERRLGAPLDVLFEAVREAFGLPDTGYAPRPPAPAEWLARCAGTGPCPERGRVLRGEVHDPTAWRLGGVAGHAGLFGTARDVAAWAQALLDAWDGRPSPVAGSAVRAMWSTPAPAAAPSSWRLGFDSPTPGASSAGSAFGPRAVGHLGFTGTSVWIEPDEGWVVVLLSNRTAAPSAPHEAIKALRPRFHDAVAAMLRDGRRGGGAP